MTDINPKTLISFDGRILFYELNHFINDIVNGNCCFICGAKPSEKIFNDEHVIPDWILKKYNLREQKITLPNQTKIQYSKYKVPCCQKCNAELGKHFEEPISELLSKPYEQIAKELNESSEKRDLLFRWLCLIYFKTHLKDRDLRENKDYSAESSKIGDRHLWEDFHHIHCLVRSHHTGAKIDTEVYGSLYANKIINEEGLEPFDYIDNPWTKGVLLQLGDFCIASILDDSCASISIYSQQISKIEKGISIFQFYEIFSHFNYIRLHLVERPIFQSLINSKIGYNIIAKRPEKYELINKSERIGTYGDFLRIYAERSMKKVPEANDILNLVGEGKWTFLWDENGKFIDLNKRK